MKGKPVKSPEPYAVSQNELKQIQAYELEMLIEIDRICRKCGIILLPGLFSEQFATRALSRGTMTLM